MTDARIRTRRTREPQPQNLEVKTELTSLHLEQLSDEEAAEVIAAEVTYKKSFDIPTDLKVVRLKVGDKTVHGLMQQHQIDRQDTKQSDAIGISLHSDRTWAERVDLPEGFHQVQIELKPQGSEHATEIFVIFLKTETTIELATSLSSE